MGQIRTAKAGDVGAFPGSKFVINNTPPIAQCEEAQIVDGSAIWVIGQNTVIISSSLDPYDLVGKFCDVVSSFSDNGTYEILAQAGQVLTIDHTWVGEDTTSTILLRDLAGNFLTRNQSSFTRFIESEGKAHTTKGGQLFTDIADPPMDDACSETFEPQ